MTAPPQLLAIYHQDHDAIAGEIEQDLRSLERIMEALGVGRDVVKDPVAWVGERFARLKRNGRLDDLRRHAAEEAFEGARARG